MIWQRHAIRVARLVVGVAAAVVLSGCAHTTLNDLIHSRPADSADQQQMAQIKARIAQLQEQLKQMPTTPEPATQASEPETPSVAPQNLGKHSWQLVTRLGEEEGNHPLYSYVLFSAGNQPLSAVDVATRDSLANFLDEIRNVSVKSKTSLFVVPAVLANADEQPALTNYNAGFAAKLLDRALAGAQTTGRPAGMFLLVTAAPLEQVGAETPRLLIDCTSLPNAFRQTLLKTVASFPESVNANGRLAALSWALVEATSPSTPALTLRHSGPLVFASWLR